MAKDNRRQRGFAFQRWIKKWMEERGFYVHNQTGTMSFIRKGKTIIPVPRNNDIFNCIDLICKKKRAKTWWIQATLDTNIKRKTEKLSKIPWGPNDDVQLWLKRKGGEVDIFRKMPRSNVYKHYGKIIRRKYYSLEGGGDYENGKNSK